MARRRKLEAPSAEDLAKLDAETAAGGFAAKPRMAPIAQVAAEAASLGSAETPEQEAARVRDRRDAEAWRRAEAEGWLVRDLPLEAIRTDGMTRDRMRLDPEGMEELRGSIRENGLRLPIEVTERDGGQYDLVSGLRRLTATRDVAGQGATIRAFVRPARSRPEALVAMVEENEMRADLSSYERGRIAATAVRDGAFPDLEAATNALFAQASKAKRSKVRSFALVHEELGDLLTFPQELSERQCLRLAKAIKARQGPALRQALGTGMGTDAEAEWGVLAPVLAAVLPPEDGARRRRAKDGGAGGIDPADKLSKSVGYRRVELANGMSARHVTDAKGHMIRFEGPVSTQVVEAVMHEIERLLGPL
ncbi:ParB N-terminal domain-containing protein [Jannaschia sp. Os4]|uniref:ParB/RepB/Spo0J family partition protein n=1 Tax=Jannaschia sp. Os4 TaxID=2807617 RepID=UPI001939BC55|nr:ParB N-terminal domain-containing protein [Jannaschia sp. Os4]MBM2578007.1 ParB N-terminal domain-containing protein [Jannaschia sp. Os4]